MATDKENESQKQESG